jgi:uncharacterized membrane protein SpoIIM required for sporulation
MTADEFIRAKRSAWQRLEALLAKSGGGGRLAALSADELHELGALYRQTTSDLAVARRDYNSHRVAEFLNGLVGRAHANIYRNEATTWRRLRDAVVRTFPQTWRATAPFTIVATLLFLVPALVAGVVSYLAPTEAGLFFPGAEALAQQIESGQEWWRDINQSRTGNAALIASNNIYVTIQAFAGGLLAGTLTIYAMIFNGLMLGVVAGLSAHHGFSAQLWSFIAAHASIELSVIVFAGGAGLQLAWAIVHPGLFTRGAALRVAAQRAIVIMLGCIPLLMIAGTIEAFISPSDLPVWVKAAVSIGTGVALYSYLLGAGRDTVIRGGGDRVTG